MEMRRVDGVFRHLLIPRADLPAPALEIRPFIAFGFGDALREIEFRRRALGVMPDHHEPGELAHDPRLDARLLRLHLRIRDVDALALTVEGPSVKWAADILSLDDAAMAEMSAEMRTEGVEHGDAPALGAKGDQILRKISERHHLPGGQLIAIGDLEPTIRNRRGEKSRRHPFKLNPSLDARQQPPGSAREAI